MARTRRGDGLILAAWPPPASAQLRGECKFAPPDSLPTPPVVLRSDVEIPGAISIEAHDLAGNAVYLTAVLDRSLNSANGNLKFTNVQPGAHALMLRSFGYGQRDTVVTMPRDSGLRLTVPFSHGGGATICSDYFVEPAQKARPSDSCSNSRRGPIQPDVCSRLLE